MKTMTCKDMGGPCDAKISGKDPEDMIQNGMKHVEKDHPEMAADIEKMSDEDSEKWRADFQAKWDEAPEL